MSLCVYLLYGVDEPDFMSGEHTKTRWDCPCRHVAELYPLSLFLGWSTDPKYVELELKAKVLRGESTTQEIFVRMAHTRACVAFRKLLKPSYDTHPIRLVYFAGDVLGSWWRWV